MAYISYTSRRERVRPMSAAPQQRDLTTGPITKTLLLFALPTLGANVLQSLNQSINSIWVGNMLGETALAATSNAGFVMFLTFAAMFGLAMATTVMIGQAMGRRDVETARRTLGTAIGMVTLIGLVTGLAGWFAVDRLLHILATPKAALPMAFVYSRVMFASLPFVFLGILLSSALRGAGDAVSPLRAMMLSVGIDITLNPLLIAGIGPFPKLGIAGSAIASLIAGVVSLGYLLFYVYRKDLVIRLRGAELRWLKPDRALMGAIVKMGVPMGLTMILLSGSMLVMIGLVNRSGVETTAGYAAISQLWNYIQMPAMAVGAAVSAMAAQNIGAGRWDRIERMAVSGCAINVAMTTVMVILLSLIDRPLLGLFLTPDSPSVPIAIHIHLIVSWSFILFGISFVLTSIVRANGVVVAPLLILVVALFPARMGFAFGFHPSMGAEAIWWSFPVGAIASAILTISYYRFGNWRAAKVLPGAPAPVAAAD